MPRYARTAWMLHFYVSKEAIDCAVLYTRGCPSAVTCRLWTSTPTPSCHKPTAAGRSCATCEPPAEPASLLGLRLKLETLSLSRVVCQSLKSMQSTCQEPGHRLRYFQAGSHAALRESHMQALGHMAAAATGARPLQRTPWLVW